MIAPGGHSEHVPPRRGAASLGRLVVLAMALAVCAWYVLGIRAFTDQARVISLIDGHSTLTAAQARAAVATLNDAHFLNPDQSVQATRVIVTREAGNRRDALAIATAIARDEPQNVQNWLLLSYILVGTHSPMLRLAEARIHTLAPTVAPAP